MNNDDCRATIANDHKEFIHDKSLCTAAKRGQGGCFGDSGGPLTANGQLIGVVSWGVKCGDGSPNVFVRISKFANWIQQKTGVVAV